MATHARSSQVYEELATWYDRQGQANLRDWFLVLAADQALGQGHPERAERLRRRLLQVNPHHLVRPCASFAEALQSPDVKGYVADLRRNYPPESAQQLLQTIVNKNPPEQPPKATVTQARPEKPAQADRELKVYHTREMPEEPLPMAIEVPTAEKPKPLPPQHAEPAAHPSRMPTPIAWTKPAAPVVQRATLLVATTDDTLDEDGPTGLGYWVSSVLFVVTLLTGSVLLVYTLARPFLAL
jgi:hypothetical protein